MENDKNEKLELIKNIKEEENRLVKMHEKYPDYYDQPASEFDYDDLNSSFNSSDKGIDFFCF